jgi:hypothetical protein
MISCENPSVRLSTKRLNAFLLPLIIGVTTCLASDEFQTIKPVELSDPMTNRYSRWGIWAPRVIGSSKITALPITHHRLSG